MTTKRTIYKTVIRYTVLSEEPISSLWELSDLIEECDTGDFIGQETTVLSNVRLTGKEAVDAIKDAGSDPAFFRMDDDGNELKD